MPTSSNRFAALLSEDEDSADSPAHIPDPPKASVDPDTSKKRKVVGRKRRRLLATDDCDRQKQQEQDTTIGHTEHSLVDSPSLPSSTSLASVGTIRTLPGGVVTEVLLAAPPGAAIAKKGGEVRLNYQAWLPGKDNKRCDAGDIAFLLGDGSMLRGFDAGVVGMGVGEKRRMKIPSKMAYGKKGKKPKIPPNSDLVFEAVLVHAGVDFDARQRISAMSDKRREAAKRRGKKRRPT